MITYPNNTTVLIDNLDTLRHNILNHRCSIVILQNIWDFLYSNPYEDYMEKLILRFIKINTFNFSTKLAPFINNVLYRYED